MKKDDKETIRESFTGQEDGFIYFFYRPRMLEAHGPEDVERLYLVLRPLDSEKFRLIALDSPRLPQRGERFNLVTGTVLKVNEKRVVLQHELAEHHKQVQGSIQTSQGSARSCGEGVYTLRQSDGSTHLVYIIELPQGEREILDALGVDSEGDLEIGIYNPYYESSDTTAESPAASELPEPFRTRLDNERITYDDINTLLNFEGIHVALFRQEGPVATDLRNELHPLPDTRKTADIVYDLKIRFSSGTQPLFTDAWE
jgi:hypothetical protein